MDIDPKLMKQLLETFRVELDEQLQAITQGLLHLEKHQQADARQEILKRIFRAAHNIKGAARGVGIAEVADIAHHLESLLSTLKESNRPPTAGLIDLCLEAIDKTWQAMKAYDAGVVADFDMQSLLERLEQASCQSSAPEGEPASNPKPGPAQATEPDTPGRSTEIAARVGSGEARPNSQVIPQDEMQPMEAASGRDDSPGGVEVVRVTTDKLDRVSGLAEELQVAKIGLHEQFRGVQEIVDGINALSRTWANSKCLKTQKQAALPEELQHLIASSREALASLGRATSHVQKQMRATHNRVGLASSSLQSEVRMLRLVPVASVLRPLLRPMRDLARELGKSVTLHISGDDVEMDRVVLEGVRDPLVHLLRNAIDHGIEAPAERRNSGKQEEGNISIDIHCEGGEIIISVRDDGAGIDPRHIGQAAVRKKIIKSADLDGMSDRELLDLVFRPGFSSRESVSTVSGRGVGLDVVYENLADLKGSVRLESEPGRGARFELRMPLTLTTERGLQVRIGQQRFVLPSVSVDRILDLLPDQIVEVAAGQVILINERPVPLRELGATLGLEGDTYTDLTRLPIVVISKGWRMVAFVVDEVIGEREIVIKPLTRPLVSVSNINGATLTGSGDIMMVLNAGDLIETALSVTVGTPMVNSVMDEAEVASPRVLIVDDSLTTRTLERNILEYQGYDVTVATDGQQAWETLQDQNFDLVVSDIEMPRMDGFELTERIKQNEQLADIPVIIVSSLAADAEKQRGIEVGADAYIVKGQFETHALLEVVRRFV
jgi:chemotaxis protein histidine kinase CheA